MEPERPEYTYLEDLIREKKEQDAMIRQQAQYLAGLKGTDQTNSVNRFLLNISSSSAGQAGQLRPQLVARPPRPAQPGYVRLPARGKIVESRLRRILTVVMFQDRDLRRY